MVNTKTPAKSIDQLREERSEFFPPPRSVGDAVVTAFVLQNLASFKSFVSDKPKSFQVASMRWIRDSLEETRRSRMHHECAKNFSLPESFYENPETLDWYEKLDQERQIASQNLVLASKAKN